MRAVVFVLLLCLSAASPCQEARWWKGNLHTHSLWSDGDDFPEQIAHWYREHGYAFLAFTEHNVLAEGERWMKVDDIVRRGGRKALADYRERFGDEWVQTRTGEDGKLQVRLRTLDEFRPRFEKSGEFRMILAEEISDAFAKKPIHINATGVSAVLKPRSGTSVARAIDRDLGAVEEQAWATGRSIVAHLNHPNFYYSITAEDLAAVLRERFVEVYNGHPTVNHLGDATHAGNERLWDVASTLRIDRFHAAPLFGLATDDSHNYFVQSSGSANSGRGWVQVRARELSDAALIESLGAGDFYASSGVELRDVVFDGHTLTIDVATVDGESCSIDFVGTREGYDRSAEPVRGEDGKLVDATWRYSSDIGVVLAHADGPRASYTLEGDELYVRAVITSSRTPANPSFEGQRCQAWTQPVGWRARVVPAPADFVDVTCEGTFAEALSGLAVDPRGRIHWAFGHALITTDLRGARLSSTESDLALGDLCLRGDQLLALARASDGGARIRIFDAGDLGSRGEVVLTGEARDARAITWQGGRIRVAAQDGDLLRILTLDPGSGRIDAVEVPAEQRVDAVSLCFGEHRYWIGGRGSEPQLLVTDALFAPFARVPLDAAHGIDALPGGLFLVGASRSSGEGRFTGSVWVAEPSLAGGLQRRAD